MDSAYKTAFASYTRETYWTGCMAIHQRFVKVMLTLCCNSSSIDAFGDLWRQRRWFFWPLWPQRHTHSRFKRSRAYVLLPNIETVSNFKPETLTILPCHFLFTSLVFMIHFCSSLAKFLIALSCISNDLLRCVCVCVHFIHCIPVFFRLVY